MTEEEILKKLIIDEKDMEKELANLVEDYKKYFRIEKSGKIVFHNFGMLSDKQRIAILLIGKYFAHKLKLITDPSVSITKIAEELGRPVTTLSGQMKKELVDKGYVEYLSGKKYRIAYHRIREIFDNFFIPKQKK